MDGLAQTMAQEAPQQQGGMPTVEQIIQLLMGEVSPEELINKGVPVELIEQAITVIEQQGAAQQAPDQGLAAQSAAGMG